MEAVVVVVLAACGLAVGTAGRWWLARVRRGVVVRAGACDVAGAALFTVVGLRWVDGLPAAWLPVPLTLAAVAVPLAAVDLVRLRLPDVMTATAAAAVAAVIALVAACAGQPLTFWRAVAGGIALTVWYAAVHRLVPGGLGLGDVKLAVTVGMVLGAVGWAAVVLGALMAAFGTLLLATVGRVARVGAWRAGTPHGPAMLAAALAVCVFPGTGLGVA